MNEFDRLLYEGASQLPPDRPGAEPPKPWKKPMSRVCWGLALITVTLNFLYLDDILPTVGMVMLWLGLRSLRRQNEGFHFAFVCATLYAVFRFACLSAAATPLELRLTELIDTDWHSGAGDVSFYYVLRTAVAQLLLVLALGGLWRGLRRVFRDAGQTPRTASAGALVILEALFFPLALIGLTGWLLVGPVLLIWVLLIRSLYKLSRSLDEAGYALVPAPVRLSNGRAAALWLGVPLLAVAALPFLFARLPVNAETPVYEPSNSESELRVRLLELGFPEAILYRLHDGQLSRFEGAYGVTVDGVLGDDFEGSGMDGSLPSFGTVEVPVRDGRYGFRTVYLAWFRWGPAEERYTEGIQIAPDLKGVTLRTVCPEGWLEWYEDGEFHTAPLTFRFHSDSSRTGSYCADFSLPEGGGTVYGYVFWENIPVLPDDIAIYNYSITCAHRLSPWHYPYQMPSDILLAHSLDPGWRSKNWAFEGQLAPEGKYGSIQTAPAGPLG